MGTIRIQISGSLGDLIDNLQKFITDLTTRGVNPGPLRTAGVVINFQDNITAVQANNVAQAIADWRAQVVGTTITVNAEFAIAQ